jgi:hypothetical protein
MSPERCGLSCLYVRWDDARSSPVTSPAVPGDGSGVEQFELQARTTTVARVRVWSVALAALVCSCGAASVAGASAPGAVQIVRTPGSLALAPLARTVTNSSIAGRLAAEVRSLPAQPVPWHCPNDYGTLYTLTFVTPGVNWSAVVDAQGCQTVQIGSGRKLTAANSPRLWEDLATALGLTPLEVDPTLCPGTKPGTVLEGHLCSSPT